MKVNPSEEIPIDVKDPLLPIPREKSKLSSIPELKITIEIVCAIGYLIGRPDILNFPIDINNNNRDSAYRKMQIFLSITAIIVSDLFSLIIFDAIGLLSSGNALYFVIYFFVSIVGLPLIIVRAKLK